LQYSLRKVVLLQLRVFAHRIERAKVDYLTIQVAGLKKVQDKFLSTFAERHLFLGSQFQVELLNIMLRETTGQVSTVLLLITLQL
jgi:hypothetical protein